MSIINLQRQIKEYCETEPIPESGVKIDRGASTITLQIDVADKGSAARNIGHAIALILKACNEMHIHPMFSWLAGHKAEIKLGSMNDVLYGGSRDHERPE